MSASTSLPYRRLFAELLVIVIGVMVALAADRWVNALDEKAREDAYLGQLISNLATDSVTLDFVVSRADARHRFAVEVLEGRIDPALFSPDSLINLVETLVWWAPMDYSREAWDDLMSTGALTLIGDDDLRLSLSAYYNETERLAIIEADWFRQVGENGDYRLRVLTPLQRLQALDALLPESQRTVASPEAVTDVLRVLREEPDLAADIGNVALIYRYQARMFGRLQAELAEVLRRARGAL